MDTNRDNFPTNRRMLMVLPRSMSKMIIRAPLVFAPNASALPAPPAPTRTNNFPESGEEWNADPFVHPLTERVNDELVNPHLDDS